MAARGKLSLAVCIVVFAATCMCVCTDSPAAPIAHANKPHSCCDVDHGKSTSDRQPSSHDDCRICGLKIWSGARTTNAVSFSNLHDLAILVAIVPATTQLPSEFTTHAIQTSDPPPPVQTLLALHCQLTC
jgi:hypothetical protein